jgi:hypothetical protein
MPISLNVKADIREVNRMLGQLKRGGPTAIARALNDTARTAQSKAIKETAKGLHLARKYVAWRFDEEGRRKGDRSKITKATRTRLAVFLDVYMRGIPVFQIANKAPTIGKQRRGGVKAKGGRFYKGAFYAPVGGGVKVFKRRTSRRYPVMLPTVGVRERLDKKYKTYTLGRMGRAEFRRNYERNMRAEIKRAEARGKG